MSPPQLKQSKSKGLSPQRLALVEAAFHKLDREGSGFAALTDMKVAFDAARHPRAVDGSMSQSMVREGFFKHFEPLAAQRGNGTISWDEFLTYYNRLSTEVDAGRDLNHDALFELIVTKVWRLDDDEREPLPVTNIIPITLDRPVGLHAARNMDLVWPNEAGDGLLGFRAVVKSVFARKDLPPHVRGYLAFPEETKRHSHRYLPVQAALTPPLDLIWESSPGSGQYRGYRAVVLSNVDMAALPDVLKRCILTRKQSSDLNVDFIEADQPVNPAYKKSSQAYGFGAEKHCEELLQLKKAVFTGDAKGGVFAGRTGKFSNEFGGGMYRNSGLNATTNPHKKLWE